MNNNKTTFYIVRHGQSIGNVNIDSHQTYDPTLYGQLESPLTELGKQQAYALADKLQHIHFDAIFSSDLNRARETAEIIAEKRGLTVVTDNTIRERYFGNNGTLFTKKHRLEIEKSWNGLADREKLKFRYFPDGESALESVGRLVKFLNKISTVHKNKIVLVVNHGNIMRSLLIHLQWVKHDDLPSGSIENTGYYVLEISGQSYTVKETYKVNKNSNTNEE